MTLISTTKTPDLGKALTTDAGKQLQDILEFLVSDLADTVIRTLRNGITLTDNINGIQSQVSVPHDTWTEIATGGKIPTQVWVGRVVSTTAILTGFGWYLDGQSRLQVKARFDPAPAAGVTTEIVLSILF